MIIIYDENVIRTVMTDVELSVEVDEDDEINLIIGKESLYRDRDRDYVFKVNIQTVLTAKEYKNFRNHKRKEQLKSLIEYEIKKYLDQRFLGYSEPFKIDFTILNIRQRLSYNLSLRKELI